MTGRINIRSYPARVVLGEQYNAELIQAMRSIESDCRNGLPLPRLVWRARAAYFAAWQRELARAQ